MRVLCDESSPAAAELVRAIGARFDRLVAVGDSRQLRATSAPLAYLAIGADALVAASAEPLNAPLVSILVSRQAFERIVPAANRLSSTTAIHAEPAPANQMQVVRALFRRRVTVGALVSPSTAYMAELIAHVGRLHGLEVHTEVFDAAMGLSRNLLRISDAAAVLVFPDADVYPPRNLRELLETTYRRRQPVIGFSAALVTAGTLASAVSNADDLAAHLAALVPDLSERRIPPSQYPRYWRVAVNNNVARSLDVVVAPDVRQLGVRP